MIPLKVLFVEDDQVDQLAFQRFVEEHGLPITYTLAGSLSEAKCLVGQGEFDLIVADYSLGDGTAMDLLPFAQGVPVILLTGVGDEEIAARAFTAGIADYLVKDIGRNYLEQLPERMEKAAGQRLRSTEKLQESEERYRSLFDTMAQGVVYQDAAGQIIHANPAAEKILGLSLDQMQGRTSVDPRWRAIHEDGADFPGETHPASVALRTGQEVRDVVMGIFNPAKEAYSWIMIDAVPQFHPDEEKPHRVYTTFDDITGRKNAEDALRESEERYRSLFEHMVDGYAYCKMLFDDQGHPVDFLYLDVNRAFKRLAGLENVEDKPVSEAIPGIREPHPDLFQSYGRVASTGTPEKFEIDFQPSNKWFSISVYSPAREYFVAVFEDITERKREEEALQESEERFKRVSLVISDFAYSCRQPAHGSYQIDWMTGAVERITGYSVEEVVDRKCWSFLVLPEDLPLFERDVTGLVPGQSFRGELRIRHKSGEVRWLQTSTECLVDLQDPSCHRIFGGCVDITERKWVEEALYFSNQRLELAQQSAGAGTWDWDMTRQHLDWSRELYLLFGLDPDQVEATFDIWHQALHPDDREIFSHHIEQTIKDKTAYTDEYRVIHPDGQVRWIRALGNTIYDQSGQPLRMTGICIDITERKELEERIRQVRSDLLFAVSHDLKTPLQVLNQSQEMLNELTPGEGLARFQEYQQIWRRNLQRLERMINNLVDSQRGEEDRFPILLAPCRLEEIVQRVVEDLTGYALALQVQFNLQLEPVPESACDEEAIARMVENLLTNAVKFSPKGGRVEIRLRMEEQTLRLEVEDHGLGIPANEQEQLFQPFQRGSAQRKGVPGTGLGLYVCRRIMEAHGGSISLQSTEGVGTTVTVTLPLKK